MNGLYYTLKPLIPRDLQIVLRRLFAAVKGRNLGEDWFISESSAQPPPGWLGWPDGKKFALVLTHDVEGPEGLPKCRSLAELEKSLGFRSAFYLVPKKYDVPAELLDYLHLNEFEIGIHGLYHDGKLYRSREIFKERAVEINRYIEKWGAKGFRSPAMHWKGDWLHDLNIQYDGSAFDCDPFEMQSSQVKSIFPFVVGADPVSYIELPCTFPQDFTLFVISKYNDINVWKRKLDWLAAKGGMALLLTHPDYMKFTADPGGNQHYPYEFYEEFLHYTKTNYNGRYWHVLPHELARFFKARPLHRRSCRASRERSLRVCMVAYSFYDYDNRVIRYAETLQREGHHVDVVSLRKRGMAGFGNVNGVNVYRIQQRTRDEERKLDYLSRIVKFLFKTLAFLTKQQRTERYDLIHVHSVPDFLVFSALLPKLRGTKIILDIHDILPEFYTSKFGSRRDSSVFKSLALIERASSAFADHVIIANDLWRKLLIERSVAPEKCTTVLNYPDNKLFFPHRQVHDNGSFVMCYPGTVNWHQGLDLAVRAAAEAKKAVPKLQFHIYGEGDSKEHLKRLIEELGLEGTVFLKDQVPFSKVAEVMVQADLGIVPKRRNSFGNTAFSTKILEFMSLGVPVLIADTDIDRYYFSDSNVKFFHSGDVDDLADSIRLLAENKTLRDTLAANALEFVQNFSWETKKQEYLDIVYSLVGG